MVDFASPEDPLASPLAPFGRSLDGLDPSWDALVDRLGPLLGRFLALLGDTRAPEGPWDALVSDFDRVWPDFAAFRGGFLFAFWNESAFELAFDFWRRSGQMVDFCQNSVKLQTLLRESCCAHGWKQPCVIDLYQISSSNLCIAFVDLCLGL